MSDHEGETIDLAALAMSTPYQVADALLAAIVHAETLDRVTWITRQGKVVAAIAPADYVSAEVGPEPGMAEKLDEILGIIRGRGNLCARCGRTAEGFARDAEGRRLCHSDTRDCYKQYLWDEMRDRLGPEMRADLERDRLTSPLLDEVHQGYRARRRQMMTDGDDHDEQADDQGKDPHRT